MFAGTPYAHDPLGTRPSFDATTGAMLSDFYKKWYTPGNAILVIVGDVDPAATIARVKELFGDISTTLCRSTRRSIFPRSSRKPSPSTVIFPMS